MASSGLAEARDLTRKEDAMKRFAAAAALGAILVGAAASRLNAQEAVVGVANPDTLFFSDDPTLNRSCWRSTFSAERQRAPITHPGRRQLRPRADNIVIASAGR